MMEKFNLRKAFLIQSFLAIGLNGLMLYLVWGMPNLDKAVTLAALFAGNALLVGFGAYLGAHYAKRAETIVHAMNELGKGKLSVKLKLKGRDDFSWLAYEYDTARRGVAGLVSGIEGTAGGVAAEVKQLSTGAARITAGCVTQSEAAAHIASSVEESVQSVGMVAEGAREAQEVAEKALKLAADGQQMLGRVIEEIEVTANSVRASSSMIDELGRKSESINAMVQVIRDIADQTNLLALNAAIEAARAGEQGRGFAVVADEVRKLAEKSSQSALDITSMIEDVVTGTRSAVAGMNECVDHVGTGVALARETGEVVTALNEGANRTLEQIAAIAAAMGEQRSAAMSISSQIEQIATMAESNRVDAEKNSAVASELDRHSSALQASISTFLA